MSKRPIRRDVETINPMFHIPEGVDELVYDDESLENSQYAEGTSEESEIVIEEEVVIVLPETNTPEEEDTSGRPPAPRIIGIVKQTLRTLKSGDERVDVVLEVEDIAGVDKYEFRVSKAS